MRAPLRRSAAPAKLVGPSARGPAKLVLIHGVSDREVAKVAFGVRPRDRSGKALPAGVFLVTTARARKPYVFDLLLYVNVEVRP